MKSQRILSSIFSLLHYLLYITCWHDTGTTTSPLPFCLSVAQLTYLFNTSIYKILWSFTFILDMFAAVTSSTPTFLNYTPLNTHGLSHIFSTCSDFASVFHAYTHQTRQVWTLTFSAREWAVCQVEAWKCRQVVCCR